MKINLLRSNSLPLSQDKNLILSIKTLFGFTPGNIYLYKLAFRHRSAAIEVNPSVRISNERLEYLGDAILSAVVADFLFKMFPLKDEGFLTEMRSKIVSRSQLNKLSQRLGLDQFIESQQDSTGHNKSMMGDAFEAFIGAIYLDKGYNFTRKIITERIIAHHFDLEELETTDSNFKSKLLEWSQKEKVTIEFAVVNENGSGHKKQYVVEVLLDGKSISKAVDFSIKGAEQFAAEKALEALQGK
ncbi:MAG: ribonuclease III [Bacteroidales bacterium]